MKTFFYKILLFFSLTLNTSYCMDPLTETQEMLQRTIDDIIQKCKNPERLNLKKLQQKENLLLAKINNESADLRIQQCQLLFGVKKT